MIAVCVPQMQEVSVEKREKVDSAKRKSPEIQAELDFQGISGARGLESTFYENQIVMLSVRRNFARYFHQH